ncbi:hypothetical protein CCACVL1_07686, partial [Corchorus capsularis]
SSSSIKSTPSKKHNPTRLLN